MTTWPTSYTGASKQARASRDMQRLMKQGRGDGRRMCGRRRDVQQNIQGRILVATATNLLPCFIPPDQEHPLSLATAAPQVRAVTFCWVNSHGIMLRTLCSWSDMKRNIISQSVPPGMSDLCRPISPIVQASSLRALLLIVEEIRDTDGQYFADVPLCCSGQRRSCGQGRVILTGLFCLRIIIVPQARHNGSREFHPWRRLSEDITVVTTRLPTYISIAHREQDWQWLCGMLASFPLP